MKIKDKDYLKHVGVLGMHWGVHRETILAKDLINSKDRKIKKGTAIQNISDKELLDLSSRNRLYTSYTKFDNDGYGYLMGNFMYGKNAYKNTFFAKKDIKIPSDKKAVEIFLKTVKENPKEVARDMTKAYNETTLLLPRIQFLMERKFHSMDLDNPDGKEARKLAKEFMTRTVMSKQVSASSRFYANILKEGYDAISDTNDRAGTRQDPLVIVNMKAIKKGGSVKLTRQDLDYYLYAVGKKEHTSKEDDLSEIQR